MSAATRGIVEIELKSDRFTGPARQAATDFQNLGTKGTRSLRSIEQSSRQTTTALQNLGSQGQRSMNTLNASAQRTAGSMKATTASDQRGPRREHRHGRLGGRHGIIVRRA